MLWHPASLHDPDAAANRAADLLSRMAAVTPGVPDDPAVIAAEVNDLLEGDIPFFATTPREGRLTGPGGTVWLAAQDLISATLTRWREADLDLDCQVIQASLVSAYLNEGQGPSERRLILVRPQVTGLERRRDLVATLIRQISRAAVRGPDGTVTWIGPVLNLTGWAVEPLIPDTYTGLAGLAVLLAAYQREAAAGRADVIISLEANGPVTGMSRDTFTPGLLPGLGGIAYQLLRLHPASGLPSVLTLATP